jgi:hypothetical protein
MLGNSLGTCETYWEPIENSMGTHLELHGNALRMKKIQQPDPLPHKKEKNAGPLGACCLTSLAERNFLGLPV